MFRKKAHLTFFLLVFTAMMDFFGGTEAKCAWDNCFTWTNDDDIIKVHILSHTHDDMGWIKTVDEYYTGMNYNNSPVGVQYILNTVITELLSDPRRKFVYAETGFLQKYLDDHGPEQLEKLKKLVLETGQLELIGGGWVQPDEAATHYVDLIDQYTLGLRVLDKTFGECGLPRTSWQIDPFGHSREHASLLSQIGYDSLYFTRQHFQELEDRKKNKSLEIIWKTSNDLDTHIFTSGFSRGTYAPPSFFCFDVLCRDEPIIDNPRLQDYNIVKKAEQFTKIVNEQVSYFKHNHALITMGGDFQYTNANQWFTNIERLMKHINENSEKYKLQLFYSTTSCYTQAVRSSVPLAEWPTKSTDFYPYAMVSDLYWTGYFTSKPGFKRIVRDSSALLQLARQLSIFAERNSESVAELEEFEQSLGLAQHHDGVTGTSKQFVTEDYQRRLFVGQDAAESSISKSFKILAAKSHNVEPPAQVFCSRLNESVCETSTKNKAVVVTVFNSNSHPAPSTLIRIPYGDTGAIVFDSNGHEIPSAVSKTFVPSPQYDFQNETAPYELSFKADVPPLGFTSFFVQAGNSTKSQIADSTLNKDGSRKSNNLVRISNGLISLYFNKSTGFLVEFYDQKRRKHFKLSQRFLKYKSSLLSGAYIFSPEGDKAQEISSNVNITVVKSNVYEEVRQQISPYVSQVVRLWPNQPWVEFDYSIGPLPKNSTGPEGHEVITRYMLANFDSDGEFQTDANGRQMVKRYRNYYSDFKFDPKQNISGNYYPVNSRISIEDKKNRLTVLTDRSQGGSSLRDGEIELMLHRRAFNDDNLGVEENLDEPGEDGRGLVIRGSHYLVLESVSDKSAPRHRPLAAQIFHKPRFSFASLGKQTIEDYIKNVKTSYSFLNDKNGALSALPYQLNVLSLQWLSAEEMLLRLEHIYQNNENEELSKEIEIDIQKDIFADNFKVFQVEELMLAANRPIASSKIVSPPYDYSSAKRKPASLLKKLRLHRLRVSATSEERNLTDSKLWNDSRRRLFDTMTPERKIDTVRLKSMQIRTFKIIVQKLS